MLRTHNVTSWISQELGCDDSGVDITVAVTELILSIQLIVCFLVDRNTFVLPIFS